MGRLQMALKFICMTSLLFFQVRANDSQNFHNVDKERPEMRTNILDLPECNNMKRFCGNHYDDLLILECLYSLHPNDLTLTQKCQQVVWEQTNNLIKDNNVQRTLGSTCDNDIIRLNCKSDSFKCLVNNKETIENKGCQDMVSRLENVVFTDYKFLENFLDQCEKDVQALECGKIDPQGQMKTIACLQNKIVKVSDNCKREVFRLSELQSDNFKWDQQLYVDCIEDYSKYCSQLAAGSGHVYHCLMRQDTQKLSNKCKESLSRREKLISQDYKVSKGLMKSCKEYIKKSHCRKQTSMDKTVRLAQILLCLENIIKNGSKISSDCELELVEHRRMLMEDYRLSPEIVDKCKKEVSELCDGLKASGNTIHCLMKQAKLNHEKINKDCEMALEDLIKESDAGENWKVDPVLHKACSSVVNKLCNDITSGEARVMNCLMDNVGADEMTEECEDALVQIQYFISRRFELDDQLFRACKSDVSRFCKVNIEWNDVRPVYNSHVLPCLYRYINNESKTLQLTRVCLQNVRRVMRQRATSVDLDPAIEESCLSDLGSFCRDKIEKGEEMQCLQEKYNDLEDKCRETIELFTEIQAERIELNPYIKKYCSKIIDSLCHQEAIHDEGDVMECLISHKNDAVVKGNPACRGSIEHFQIISLNDYRFSYKFKAACKPYAIRFCGGARNKSEIIRCLSEQVLNATIRGIKTEIPRDCKQQLKAQLFQQHENINFDPVLKAACSPDINKYCGHISSGNAQVIECLKAANNDLSDKCEKEIFKMKKQAVYDNSVDYSLNTACADAIDHFCPHYEKENILECLKQNMNRIGLNDKKCERILNLRIVEQNSNYQLNPSLQQNCHLDMNKFCGSSLGSRSKETNGLVIKCLKEQFKLSRLSNKCEKQMAVILREQALNINLNPLIRTVCKNELQTICKTDESEDVGDTEECLKDALLNSRIQTPECKVEVANMIEESHADIEVDPLLQQSCALDLLSYCSEISPGNGRHINCLKITMESNKRLEPKCKNMLKKRLEMYRNAALLAPLVPPENFKQLYTQVVTSPSKQYFLLVLMTFLGAIFIVGIFCGRLNKRRYMILKSK